MINFSPGALRALGIKADALEALICDLQKAIDVYDDHMRGEKRMKYAKWSDHFACAWERLVEIAEDAPDDLPMPLPDLPALRRAALNARVDAKLLEIKNPPNQPPYRTDVRNYLAQKSKEIIERHCGTLPKAGLRIVVKTILKHVGASYPNPQKDPNKFDAMFAPRKRRLNNPPSEDFRF